MRSKKNSSNHVMSEVTKSICVESVVTSFVCLGWRLWVKTPCASNGSSTFAAPDGSDEIGWEADARRKKSSGQPHTAAVQRSGAKRVVLAQNSQAAIQGFKASPLGFFVIWEILGNLPPRTPFLAYPSLDRHNVNRRFVGNNLLGWQIRRVFERFRHLDELSFIGRRR